MELLGKRVLITGASRGIGLSLAEAFAGAGATVALVARDGAALESLATRLGGTSHPADLLDTEELRGLVHRVEDEAGAVDVRAADLRGPVVLVVGQETTGLSSAWREACDELVSIPMRGSASSLNLAAAATVVLHEASRQRL